MSDFKVSGCPMRDDHDNSEEDRPMQFRLHEGAGPRTIDIDIRELIIAGMTGRNVAAVQAHVDELAALGIAPPSTIPIYYRVSASLLTDADAIQVIGADSSGEVEAVLIGTVDGMLVAVGSDHTDRRVEAYGIAVSKQMCAKPVSPDLWRYADVAEAWDSLELASDRVVDGQLTPYQRGALATVRRPEDLIAGFFDGATELPPGFAMFTGTFATLGEIAGADRFEISLIDPGSGLTLRHGYDVTTLPVVA
jgi:hypothetical protein